MAGEEVGSKRRTPWKNDGQDQGVRVSLYIYL